MAQQETDRRTPPTDGHSTPSPTSRIEPNRIKSSSSVRVTVNSSRYNNNNNNNIPNKNITVDPKIDSDIVQQNTRVSEGFISPPNKQTFEKQ